MRTIAFLIADVLGEMIWRSSSTGVSLLLDIVIVEAGERN